MAKKTKDKQVLQWHPAFFASIQIELAEEADQLIFENEHQLGTKPKEIDVLIIKKNSEEQIRKNLGRIFRTHNIVEYKSPDDYLSIDDFYKVYGYACFYKSDVAKVDAIKVDDITVTFVCKSYPHKMMKHVENSRQLLVNRYEDGIYYIQGDIIPMQLIVTSELSEEDNLWLRYLTNDLHERTTVEQLIEAYGEHRDEKLYKSAMDIIVRANYEKFEEVREMCDALEELMEDWIQDKIVERENIAQEKGHAEAKEEIIINCLKRNKDAQIVSDFLGIPLEVIKEIEQKMLQSC